MDFSLPLRDTSIHIRDIFIIIFSASALLFIFYKIFFLDKIENKKRKILFQSLLWFTFMFILSFVGQKYCGEFRGKGSLRPATGPLTWDEAITLLPMNLFVSGVIVVFINFLTWAKDKNKTDKPNG